MAKEVGIGAYFDQGRIRIRYKTIENLGFPEYIHLRLNEEKKYLFIEGCEQDIIGAVDINMKDQSFQIIASLSDAFPASARSSSLSDPADSCHAVPVRSLRFSRTDPRFLFDAGIEDGFSLHG